MTVVTVSAKGRIPPDEVWQRYAQLSRWTEWAPQLSRVDATDDTLAYGVTGRVYGPLPVVLSYAPIARVALQFLVSKSPPSQQTPDRDIHGNLREQVR